MRVALRPQRTDAKATAKDDAGRRPRARFPRRRVEDSPAYGAGTLARFDDDAAPYFRAADSLRRLEAAGRAIGEELTKRRDGHAVAKP